METKAETWNIWLRGFAQSSTYLGLAMIALLWLGFLFYLSVERATVQREAVQNAGNLARAFEEDLVGTLQGVDRTLKLVRSAYEQDPAAFDLDRWSKQQLALDDPAFQIVIIGPDGYMKATTEGQQVAPLYLGDREHFRVHVNARSDDLFISKPLIGRVTGKVSLQLSRRVRNPDGGFAGVILISLDPGYFTRFYNSIEIGHDGTIRVIGTDGVVRAVGPVREGDYDYLGKNVAGSTLIARGQSETSGWYFSNSTRNDHIPRLIFYRVVHGFPLIVTVGLGVEETFRSIAAKRRTYFTVGAIATLLILFVMGFSVYDRVRLERASRQLATQNLRFNAALNNMSQGLAMVDANRRLVVCNRVYARMFGLSATEPQGQRMPEPTDELRTGVAASPAAPMTETTCQPGRVERSADGRDLLVVSQPMADGGLVTTYEDVTERLQHESRIAHMARHDALTSLPNRMLFLERLDDAVAKSEAPGAGFAVFMLDLDRFKMINDTLGHATGDELLQKVAQRLQSCAGRAGTVARLGGDEFAVLQPGERDQNDKAVALAQKIIRSLSQPYVVNGHELIIGVSVGIAIAPEHGTGAEQILRNADLALYRSKARGRNAYCLFADSMEAELQIRGLREARLRHALERDEFELHYQTVIDLTTREVCGVEALIRWRPDGGQIVYPNDFIPIAEDIGLIAPIGKWVLATACAEATRWPPHIKLAVNLSPAQFGRGDLVEVVAEALRETGLPASRLELEITESVLLQSNEDNLHILRELKALGVCIVLDDFGTGYSSLSYLRMFAFDKIKIDRSFVTELVDRIDCAAIVSAVINLGKTLNVRTVAEGVETERQVRMLRVAGCSEAQGYLFGRPVPAEALSFQDHGRVSNG